MKGSVDEDRVEIWQRVTEAISDTNAFGNLRMTMEILGIASQNAQGYHVQFGIPLNARRAQPIWPDTGPGLPNPPIRNDLAFEPTLQLNYFPAMVEALSREGINAMIDMPNLAVQTTANTHQAYLSKPAASSIYGTIMACYLSPTADQISGLNRVWYPALAPRDLADNIFWDGSHSQIRFLDYENAKVFLLKPPTHGRISSDLSPGKEIRYVPNAGYTGDDKIIFLVDIEGYIIRVVFLVKVNEKYYLDASANPYSEHCPHPNWWESEHGEPIAKSSEGRLWYAGLRTPQNRGPLAKETYFKQGLGTRIA